MPGAGDPPNLVAVTGAEDRLALLLFVTFALLSAGGAYLIAARVANRRVAIAWSAGVVAFFVLLFAGIVVLLRRLGV